MSITTNGWPEAENSADTNRPMRPKPHTITWSFSSESVCSMRCLPMSPRTSPLTMARMAAVAAYNRVKTPTRLRAIVNTRPSEWRGWTSPKPTVVIVMTVM